MTTPPSPSGDDSPHTVDLALQESAPGEPADPAEPSRRRRFGSRVWAPLLLVVGCAAALFVVGLVSKSDPAAAKAGDCVREFGGAASPKMEIVACTKPDANYKVIEVFHDGARTHPCDSVLGKGVFGSYSEERRSSIVTICLGLNGDRPGGPPDDIPTWAKEH
ncbi:hypothetical protein [Kitasatospora sp. NPDC047058]|uniref:LppU/SCO3897 family protein n=1 Tax=Kitasatospora sp. NPDC047058 TaxID=3155620 RepID=UPI0033C171EF